MQKGRVVMLKDVVTIKVYANTRTLLKKAAEENKMSMLEFCHKAVWFYAFYLWEKSQKESK
jgi:uncharacterized protein (DUF1778 family)